jgi:transposase
MKVVSVLGIDLAKNIFQLHGVDELGRVALRKRVSRARLRAEVAQLKPCLIGLEACGGAHFWAREFRAMGHEVRLIAPQFVKPYRKSGKNDANDAEAICEAVARPQMRFVPIKGTEHQDVQSLHRERSGFIADRTALVNRTHGLLLEYGITISKGVTKFRKEIPKILERTDLTPIIKRVLNRRQEQLSFLDEQIEFYDRELELVFKSQEVCQRLSKIEGVGPVTATAIYSAVSDASVFKNGRQFSAWLGLVPRQNSSGSKEQLLSITKNGDRYVRQLLVHGARSLLRAAPGKTDRKSLWAVQKATTRGHNKACVAIANKNARTIWALIAKGTEYQVA